jgi:sortase A
VKKETAQVLEKIKMEPTPTLAAEDKPEPENNTFNVEIPKIGAKADIVIGISPYDKNEYKAVLKDNVIAQSQISSLPGEGKGTSVYLFAHSSQQDISAARQNSVFYLLGELGNDDMVMINYKGKIFAYRVYMKKVIKPKEIEYLEYRDENKEIVILQTCWPIGTNWQRLLVFAEKV